MSISPHYYGRHAHRMTWGRYPVTDPGRGAHRHPGWAEIRYHAHDSAGATVLMWGTHPTEGPTVTVIPGGAA